MADIFDELEALANGDYEDEDDSSSGSDSDEDGKWFCMWWL